MQPVDAGKRKGSPTTRPCANSEMSGTANEQSAADKINITEAPRTDIRAGPVTLYLIPQTISAEIHVHGGPISGRTVLHFMVSMSRATGYQIKW
ncbi:hypothetical protein L1S32_00225 [Methanogenium sp. S4BF]|uniref:hypothetical protein n=1 Tax=Methanogenium sp. S4BF TaxID=1789226 RepID=UPI00241744F2|nr:hypothetical protein [Methanogenium sp. S4BF]WFN34582.1 hypothetical protein L1S32_00225 [Methanogenium sp. S4BF]